MAKKRGNKQATSAKTLAVLARRQYVLSLRRAGMTYDAIYQAAVRRFGEELPKRYSRWNVYRDVTEALEVLADEHLDNVRALRSLELERLDQLLFALYPRALGRPADLTRGLEAVPPDLAAVREVLAIQARRARYIPGLEGPYQVAPTTPEGTQSWHPAPEIPPTFFTDLAAIYLQLAPGHGMGLPVAADPSALGRNGSTHE